MNARPDPGGRRLAPGDLAPTKGPRGGLVALAALALAALVGCGGSGGGAALPPPAGPAAPAGPSGGALNPQVVWPVGGGETPDALQDFYGPRILSGNYDFHRGLDVAAPRGTPVRAMMAGTAVRVETGAPGSSLERFGNFVVIAHAPLMDGTEHQSAYLHLDSFGVTQGQAVAAGEMIGTVGDSGVGINTVHLHFEYQVGVSNGLQNRLRTRSPHRLLPFASATPTITAAKTATTLSVTVTQAASSPDLTRFVFDPSDAAPVTIDFETREGLDTADEDTNPFGGVTIVPTDYSAGDPTYTIRFDIAGAWAATTAVDVAVSNTVGVTHRQTRAL